MNFKQEKRQQLIPVTGLISIHRIVDLARDYATKREAFGKPLKDHPLHMQTLARMEVSTNPLGSQCKDFSTCSYFCLKPNASVGKVTYDWRM